MHWAGEFLLYVLCMYCERMQIYTVDHEDGGRVRLDAEFPWSSHDDPVPLVPDEEIICDVSRGYVCARDACSVLWHEDVKWFTISADALLAWQDDMLIEYDMHTFAPLGACLPYEWLSLRTCSLTVLAIGSGYRQTKANLTLCMRPAAPVDGQVPRALVLLGCSMHACEASADTCAAD